MATFLPPKLGAPLQVGALEALVAAMQHPESSAELQFLGAADGVMGRSGHIWDSKMMVNMIMEHISMMNIIL